MKRPARLLPGQTGWISAYDAETKPERKSMAAVQRALLEGDLDERITWLRRADRESIDVKAILCESLARKAIRDGKEQEAIDQLRGKIDRHRATSAPAPRCRAG